MLDRATIVFSAMLGAAVLYSGQGTGAAERAATSRTVRGVVELFTSQGCHSCPPAEKILTRMAADPGIVALAYHVDYWDYIGWPDPHGTAANTERQRAYARAFGTGTIYTPQAVVNGNRDVVGSHAGAIEAALKETALGAPQPAKASVGLDLRGDRLHISADGVRVEGADADAKRAPAGGRARVLILVTFAGPTETTIDRGENAGLTLVNTHAVLDWRILGMWDGRPLDIDLPVSTLKPAESGQVGCAAVLQSVTEAGDPGPILAAASLDTCN